MTDLSVAAPSVTAPSVTAPSVATERRSATAAAVLQHYLELEAGDGALARVGDELELPPVLAAASAGRILNRPLFVDAADLTRFSADANLLFDAIAALPHTVFDGSPELFARALRVAPAQAAVMASSWDVPPPRYGRADMYHDGQAFRLLEFNIASEIGGIDRSGELPAAFLRHPAFAPIALAGWLSCTDTAAAVARTLIAAARPRPGNSIVSVALADAPGSLAEYAEHWHSMQVVLGKYGIDLSVCALDALEVGSDAVRLGSRVIDVILRYASVDEVLEHPTGPEQMHALVAAAKTGVVAMWTLPSTTLYGNKGCLAMISDPAVRRLSAEQAAAIDRILPWTRALDPNPIRPGELSIDELVRVCAAEREQLVLKPCGGHGGTGVVAGWECSDAQWRERLSVAVLEPQGYIVQRRVLPRPERVRDSDGRFTRWSASWGMFLTPAGFAGVYARVLPESAGAVVGLSADAQARTAAVLVCDAE